MTALEVEESSLVACQVSANDSSLLDVFCEPRGHRVEGVEALDLEGPGSGFLDRS